jgi:hypothetical protein
VQASPEAEPERAFAHHRPHRRVGGQHAERGPQDDAVLGALQPAQVLRLLEGDGARGILPGTALVDCEGTTGGAGAYAFFAAPQDAGNPAGRNGKDRCRR